MQSLTTKFHRNIISTFTSLVFISSLIFPVPLVHSQTIMPAGVRPAITPYMPVLLKGMVLDSKDPLKFQFLFDTGDTGFDESSSQFEIESQQLIDFFLTAITIPDEDFWVNLSPFQKDYIIPEMLGKTQLGKELLELDYVLKQYTSSLLNPDSETGESYWKKMYASYKKEDVPLSSFSKVWVTPNIAEVFEFGQSVLVNNTHLKVQTELDYFASQENRTQHFYPNSESLHTKKEIEEASSLIMKEVVLPRIESELNYGQQFAKLRQIYNVLVLARWYKDTIKESLINKVYADQNKLLGLNLTERNAINNIYDRYVNASRRGVVDLVKEEYDPETQQMIPKKYFTGGYFLVGGETRQLEGDQIIPPRGKMIGRTVRAQPLRLDAAMLGTDFSLDEDQMRSVVTSFTEEMEAGLAGKRRSLSMLKSYLTRSSGEEEGEFIAVDWGGSNLRVKLMKLTPGQEPQVLQESTSLSFTAEHRTGTQEELFDTIAKQIKLLDLDSNKKYSLGLTFSFPMHQTSADSARLVNWTKEWANDNQVEGVVGENIVELLQKGLNRLGMQDTVAVRAILNDTVATMLSVPGATAGVILGTGHNISVYDPTLNQIIDTNAGNFAGVPMTQYDKAIFDNLFPKFEYSLEKMVSGLFLGEVLRLRLDDLQEKGEFLKDIEKSYLQQIDAVNSELITVIESMGSDLEVKEYASSVLGVPLSLEDAKVLREETRAVSVRAGRLIASVLTAVVQREDKDVSREHTIAVDGSLYEYHPKLSQYIAEGFEILLGNEKASRIKLVKAKDGSGVGAAVAAAESEAGRTSSFKPAMTTEDIVIEEDGITLEKFAVDRKFDLTILKLLNPTISSSENIVKGSKIKVYVGDPYDAIDNIDEVLPGKKVMFLDNDQFLSWPVIDMSAEQLERILSGEEEMPEKYKTNMATIKLLSKFLEKDGVIVFLSGGDFNNVFLRIVELIVPKLRKGILIGQNGGKQVYGFDEDNLDGVIRFDVVDDYFENQGITAGEREKFEAEWIEITDETIDVFELDKTIDVLGADVVPVRVDKRYSGVGWHNGHPVQITYELDARQDSLMEASQEVRDEYFKRVNKVIDQINSSVEDPDYRIPFQETPQEGEQVQLAKFLFPYLDYRYSIAKNFRVSRNGAEIIIPVNNLEGGGGGVGALDSGIGDVVAKGYMARELFVRGTIHGLLGLEQHVPLRGAEILVGDDNAKNVRDMIAGLSDIPPDVLYQRHLIQGLVTPKGNADHRKIFRTAKIGNPVTILEDEFIPFDLYGPAKYMLIASAFGGDLALLADGVEESQSNLGPTGGIDFDIDNITKVGSGFVSEYDYKDVTNLFNADIRGFKPVIINTHSIPNLNPVLGISK